MDALRTPDERFAALPDFPFAPHYTEVPNGDAERYGSITSTKDRPRAPWCC